MTASRPFWILFLRNLSWVILYCVSPYMLFLYAWEGNMKNSVNVNADADADQRGGGAQQAPPSVFVAFKFDMLEISPSP